MKKIIELKNISKGFEDETVLAPELEAEVVEEHGVSNKSNADELSSVPKKKRLNKTVITSENSVAQQLEDQESYYYKKALKNLTRKNGKFKLQHGYGLWGWSVSIDFVELFKLLFGGE